MTEVKMNPATILRGPALPGLDECWVMDWYSNPREGQTPVGALVHRAKYARMGPAASQLGSDLGQWCVVLRETWNWPTDLVIVPVPSSSDLVLELARRVSMATRRPVQLPLVASGALRLKFVPPAKRRVAAKVRLKIRSRSVPKHVLLIDDVVESGESLVRCAELLRGAGSQQVIAVAAARARSARN
jgi:predicted amidophosphoribosyltransferase